MKNLILFDQDTLHYRQSIYKHFRKVFAEMGYNLVVAYDTKMNTVEDEKDFFIGIEYSFKNFRKLIKEYNPEIIIQFVWLRYKFILFFMLWCKLKRVRSIVWSHGVDMQKPKQFLKNQLYYLRQRLSSALIIYTPNEVKYIVASHKKLFIAYNTLNFFDFPEIKKTKEELKKEYNLEGKKIILCVGRLNTHNRKVDLLLEGLKYVKDENIHLVVVGTGVTEEQQDKLKQESRSTFLGAIFDPVKVNEIYKMSDVFVMPGGVGLAINHALYHGMPVLIEDVHHSPEAYYLKPGENGFIFNEADAKDMAQKVEVLLHDEKTYQKFSDNAYKTVSEGEANFNKMIDGFKQAIQYVEQKYLKLG